MDLIGRNIMGLRKTTEQFIKEVKEKNKHSELDLSLVEYKGCDKDVIVICPIHGKFDTQASYLLQGSGCRKCADEHRNDDRRTSMEEFITKTHELYGNKYDISLVKFRCVRDKITVICDVHDGFETTVESFLNGHGCFKCFCQKHAKNRISQHEGFYTKSELHNLWHTNNVETLAQEFDIPHTIKTIEGITVYLYPKKESDELIKYLDDFVKNFKGSEESARRQLMVNIRRKNMSFESRGLISFLQMARNLNVARQTISNYVEYLGIPYHEEIDPIGHVKVKVILLDDYPLVVKFSKIPKTKRILTEKTFVELYGSVEKAEELRINKMRETKNNWTEEERNNAINNMKIAQQKFHSDPIKRKQKAEKSKRTILEHFGDWDNYVEHMENCRMETILIKYGSLENFYKSRNEQLLKRLKEEGIDIDEYNLNKIKHSLETLSKIYGKEITNVNQIPNWKEKVQMNWKNKSQEELNEITEKIRTTMIEVYGTSNPSDFTKRGRYYYDNQKFDSSWEVYFYSYLKDNNISFQYHTKNFYFPYDFEGKPCRFYPDFIVGDKIYEVKGDHFFDENDVMINPFDLSDRKPQYKQKCIQENNVILIRGKEIGKYKKYFEEHHSDINIMDLYVTKDDEITLFV